MNLHELFTPSSSPERLGIPSSGIVQFIESLHRERINMHGFLLLRHGKIAAEGYWAPYSATSMHRMYSVSKSFVSLAIGMLIDEGRIALQDRAVTFFNDKLPEVVHPYLAQATVRDLLTMASPHSRTAYTRHDPDWAAAFFHNKPSHVPGTVFSYDTSATVILSSIVERISGTPFLSYMRERLLDPIGFSRDAWCLKTPEGTSWGGSGVMCSLRDMAKLAYVCMNKGRYHDRQLISEAYIREATSKQIDNSLSGHNGYGYQIWIERDNGFSFRGMGSQLAYCYPDLDLLFACMADTQGSPSAEVSLVHAFREHIYNAIRESPLPDDEAANTILNEKMKSLRILPQQGNPTSSFERKVDGNWYAFQDNPMGSKRMRLRFFGDEGIWEYENAAGGHRLRFGLGKTVQGTFPQKNHLGETVGTVSGKGYDCLASAAWVEEHKLNMLVYITDIHLGSLKMTVSFKENEITIFMTKAAEWFLDEYEGVASGSATP
ncbi:serine hydrolase domain-containing protein [Paenibacillus cymbidii]|uniref:serine hydrolase domain-containing protein n=1 Tax=Paenibacillus cymbidii TaxID=1639034 RepID=UPI0010820645|nr:serine hydrolase [Paenibacillus cymbidii]